MWPFPLWALVSLVLPILLLFRALYLVNATFRGRRGRKRAPRLPSGAPCSTLLVLGSGGHTAELLAIMDKLPLETYSPRHYVLASTDRIGADKARDFEAGRGSKWQLHRVPRAREVGQSFVTAIWTTIKALVVSMGVVWTVRPDLIIVNGPGTCVPIVISALLLKLLFVKDPAVVYVESFARVRSLSLTGKILYPLVDRFVVQWPYLERKYSKAEFLGRLV